ncbi:MAG: DUF3618 domain-containing protein [Acidimicrobiia bacterium]
MADRTDQLREDIDQKRDDIGYTVDQIQNRVSPGRITARGRYRFRRWWIDTRDRILGNDQSQYPWERQVQEVSNRVGNVTDRASEVVSDVRAGVAETPRMLRRQTQGNPVAAGFVAFGGGLLVGTLLPETQTERDAAQRLEPSVAGLAQEAAEIGKDVAEDVKTTAVGAIDEMKESASAAAEGVKEEAKEAMTRAREGGPVQ